MSNQAGPGDQSGSAARSRERLFGENADIIKGVQWTATLDTKTCIRCGLLDGKEFPVGEEPRHHRNCRCCSVPVLKTWRELGIDAPDPAPSTRASMNGPVPESLTYPEWIMTQNSWVQDEALGPIRAALLRSGKLRLDQFVDANGKLIRIAELNRLIVM